MLRSSCSVSIACEEFVVMLLAIKSIIEFYRRGLRAPPAAVIFIFTHTILAFVQYIKDLFVELRLEVAVGALAYGYVLAAVCSLVNFGVLNGLDETSSSCAGVFEFGHQDVDFAVLGCKIAFLRQDDIVDGLHLLRYGDFGGGGCDDCVECDGFRYDGGWYDEREGGQNINNFIIYIHRT